MFHQQFWTTQHIHQFEVLANFVHETVQEDDIDYHLQLLGLIMSFVEKMTTCMLTCSKCVHDATLQSLEKFMNGPKFNIKYVLQLGENNLKQEIQHLGMGNKKCN